MTFGRLLLLLSRDVNSVRELSRLLGLSERLVREYLELFEKYKEGEQWPGAYLELLGQLQALKKKKKKGGVSR